jgi:hypothetical protein
LTEGESRFVTIRRTGDNLAAADVKFTVYRNVGMTASDYTLDAVNTVHFDQDAETASIQVNATDDTTFERAQETFRIVLTSVVGGRIGYGQNTCTVTINDNDLKPTFWFTTTSDTITEGSGNITVTVFLSNPTYETAAVGVTYVSAGQYAKLGWDSSLYGLSWNKVLLAPGQVSKTFTIVVRDDKVVEDKEQFKLSLTAGAGLAAGFQAAAISIMDNDIPVVSIANLGAVYERHVDHQVFFTIRLVGQTAERPIIVHWSTQDGSAVAGEDYYSVTDGTSVIQISAYYPLTRAYVTIRGDKGKAPNEDFYVNILPRADYTILNAFGSCVILNDD